MESILVQDPITLEFDILPAGGYYSLEDGVTFSGVSNTLDRSMGSDPSYEWYFEDKVVSTGTV